MSAEREKEYKPFHEFVKRFRKNRLAVGAMFVILILFVVATLFYVFEVTGVNFPYGPNKTNVSEKLQGPSWAHPLGTDNLGRDVLTRMLHGTRISLLVGFVAVGVSITIGIVIGSAAGYFGSWVDSVLMRFVDVVMCFPRFFLILTVVALLKPNFWNVMVVIGLTSWTGTARFVRAEFLSLKGRDFVVAAKALGAGHARVMFRHILPNALAPVLVSATLGVAGAILTEAGLSFLGFGVMPPRPTWGNILSNGRNYIFDAWWLTVFPGIAILVTVLAFNLFGEGLRDALDPRLKIE
ncbi:MAG: ABC transporter permease [Planctomycetes bacterium]|nr:ABC transporter permease [Planctomycetota bacterium]